MFDFVCYFLHHLPPAYPYAYCLLPSICLVLTSGRTHVSHGLAGYLTISFPALYQITSCGLVSSNMVHLDMCFAT